MNAKLTQHTCYQIAVKVAKVSIWSAKSFLTLLDICILTFVMVPSYFKTLYPIDVRPRGYFHIRRSAGGGGLASKFASEILVGAPNFASKNMSDKYPKFCPLNFRYDPKIETFSQLLRLVVTELPKFLLLIW